MQLRFSALLPVVAVVALAAAAPSELTARDGDHGGGHGGHGHGGGGGGGGGHGGGGGGGSGGECTTGPIQCCETTYDSNSQEGSSLLGLLGIVLGDVVGLIGVGCSSSGVTVGGGSSCIQEPVCCNGNTFGGLISIGCSPININL